MLSMDMEVDIWVFSQKIRVESKSKKDEKDIEIGK